MKTYEEKAKELYRKFSYSCRECFMEENAQSFAILCVDEIIKAIDWHEFETPNKELEFWNEVKNEINKL